MEFLAPVVTKLLSVLEAHTPEFLAGLPRIERYGRHFTGVVKNWPSLWVMPVRSDFDPDVTGYSSQSHLVLVKFAISAAEPDLIVDLGLAYMRAIHLALAASWPEEWCSALASGQVLGLRVRGHDYGPLWEHGKGVARFPEMELVVQTAENWDGLEGV